MTALATLRAAAPALVACALLFALVHDKAFHIDDPFFLRQARQTLESPLQPGAFELAWGQMWKRASQHSASGPGMAYLLVPTAALGSPEWAAHATVCLCLALAAWMMVVVARRLGATLADAAWAALLLVTAPVVMALGATAMPDVPALLLALVGVERGLAYRDDRRTRVGLAAALGLGLAIVVRLHAVLLILPWLLLVAGRQALQSPLRWPWGRLWPALLAPGLAGLLIVLTRDVQDGASGVTTATSMASLDRLGPNLVAFLSHFVIALPLTLPWIVLRIRKLSMGVFLAFWMLAIGVLWWWEEFYWWWAVALSALAATALWDTASLARKNRDPIAMALSIWLVMAAPVCFYVHMSAKYLVLSAPAASLLLLRISSGLSPRTRNGLLGAVVAGSACVGLLIVRADAGMAEIGRRGVAELVTPRVKAGKRVWYCGSWGFQWYAEQAGARPLVFGGPEPEKGDFLAIDTTCHSLLLDRYWRQPVGKTSDEPGPHGHTMGAGAGFYSNHWGYLPWSWSREPRDEIELFRVWGKEKPSREDTGGREVRVLD